LDPNLNDEIAKDLEDLGEIHKERERAFGMSCHEELVQNNEQDKNEEI
jgi:hypothetical protein